MSEQPTIDWHYLPELPPEPEQLSDIENYLVADSDGVHATWYKGNSEWLFRNSDEVYAWGVFPDAPLVRETG